MVYQIQFTCILPLEEGEKDDKKDVRDQAIKSVCRFASSYQISEQKVEDKK